MAPRRLGAHLRSGQSLAYRFASSRLPQIRALHEGTQSGIVACNAKISAFPPEIARIDARLETFPPMFKRDFFPPSLILSLV
jgi:hypothetical protein